MIPRYILRLGLQLHAKSGVISHRPIFNFIFDRPKDTSVLERCSACTRHTSRTLTGSTIFSVSSGHGRCGVAVIRLSGPSCADAIKRLCQTERLPRPRYATLKRFYDPANKDVIDRGLVLWFPGPKSFTGEDCAEFQVHGGPAVVTAMLDVLGSLQGLKPAEPGDFTKRAFLSGKMDLTEVEGLGDLIHAETSAQRHQAIRQMEGELGNLYSRWRIQILKCLADVEAFIDFSEDENIEDDTLEKATITLKSVSQELQNHLSDNRRGERLRDGVHVAIIGEPNVGKSSLLNALSQRPAAIVSPIAGTTRDIVETAVNLAGYPVLLSDTAGLRETSDLIEKEGVRRALDRASKADLIVLVLDASACLQAKPQHQSWVQFVRSHMLNLGLCQSTFDAPQHNFQDILNQNHGQKHQCSLIHSMDSYCCGTILHQQTAKREHKELSGADGSSSNTALNYEICSSSQSSDERKNLITVSSETEKTLLISDHLIVALNKSDLLSTEILKQLPDKNFLGVDICSLSCTTPGGLDSFLVLLVRKVKELCGDPLVDRPSITHSRHRVHLTQCLSHLSSYLQQIQQGDTVLAAEALRRAMRELGRITGAVNVEDVLDVIFRDFCIGK